jgi:hypothetical protein
MSWPVIAFNEAAMAAKFLAQAKDAHLVLISARRAQSLPPCLSQWLERWAALREIPVAAVAVINDGVDGSFVKMVGPDLERILREYGLHLIAGESVPAENTANPPAGFLPLITAPLAFGQFRMAEPVSTDSCRAMGINE